MIGVWLLTGKKGSGKTTFAKKLQDDTNKKLKKRFKNNNRIYSYATPLKELLDGRYKVSIAENKYIYRKDLQLVGDLLRSYDKNFFVKKLADKIYKNIDKFRQDGTFEIIIDDVRYPNEYTSLKGILETHLPEVEFVYYLREFEVEGNPEEEDTHPSENSIKDVVEAFKKDFPENYDKVVRKWKD
jgi:hypothetical protein